MLIEGMRQNYTSSLKMKTQKTHKCLIKICFVLFSFDTEISIIRMIIAAEHEL